MKSPADIGKRLFIGFPGTSLGDGLDDLIRAVGPGGIVLFGRNIESIAQLRGLLKDAQALSLRVSKRKVWVAVDEEGGPVQRLKDLIGPALSARKLSEAGSQALIETVKTTAGHLRSLGIHINFAPVLDLGTEPGVHFLKDRALSADPEQVAHLGRLWIETLQREGISATAKHFPGLGQADLDPHHHLPVVKRAGHERWRLDLAPFQAACLAGVHGMMSSHALYDHWDPLRPATLSPRVGLELLRNRLAFRGVLFSDDLDMEAIRGRYPDSQVVRQGSEASIDVFLLCQYPERIEGFFRNLRDAIEQDSACRRAHHESLRRMDKTLGFHLEKTDSDNRGKGAAKRLKP